MAVEKEDVLRVQFAESYEHELQQNESRVTHYFKQKTGINGSAYEDDFIGQIDEDDVVENRATGAASQNGVITFTRRELKCTTLTYGTYKSDKDCVEMSSDPTNEVLVEMANVMHRKRDKKGAIAAIGTARTFNSTTGLWEDIALPATQKIAVGYGAATPGSPTDVERGLTIAKLKEMSALADELEWPEGQGQRIFIATARVLKQLLDNTQTTSDDYAAIKALVDGTVPYFLGFTFKRFEGLNVEQEGDPLKDNGIINCFAFLPKFMMFGSNLERKFKMAVDPAHSHDYHLQVEEQSGSLRRRDEGVIQCDVYVPSKDLVV